MPRPKGSRSTDAKIVKVIQGLTDLDFSSAEIQHLLDTKFGTAAPPDRTTRAISLARRRGDPSGAWSPVRDADPQVAREVMDVLAVVCDRSGGRVTEITKDEGELLGRLVVLAPELDRLSLWRLAREYLIRARDKQATKDLDLYVAFQPWKG